jgi:uncharacterized protein
MASDLPPISDVVEPAPIALTGEEKTWGMLCHLSALLGYFAAGLTFIGPLVCWLVKKDTSRFVDAQGKESLNFQLCILIYSLACFPLFCAAGIGVFLLAAVHVFSLVCVIIAGVKANSGGTFRYPFVFRLIK